MKLPETVLSYVYHLNTQMSANVCIKLEKIQDFTDGEYVSF